MRAHGLAVVATNGILLVVGSMAGLPSHGSSGALWMTGVLFVNLGASLLLGGFRLLGWGSEGRRMIVADTLTSLGGVVPLLARVTVLGGLDLGNLAFVFFLLARGWVLVWFMLANTERFPSTPLRVWIFATSLLLYAGATIPAARRSHTEGDEPHYLLATHSLVADGDLDLANNYKRKDYLPFFPADLVHRHVLVNERNEDVPVHDVGISALLVPGYAVGGKLGAMFELNVIAALLALGIYELARRLGASQASSARAWSLFALTSPLLVYSSQIYPEVVGAALAVWATVEFARARRTGSTAHLVAAGTLLALLPWFSVRYWLLVAPLGIAILLGIAFSARGQPRFVLSRVGLVLLPGLISVALFCLFDRWLFQAPLPNAGYVLYMTRNRPPMFTPQLADISFLGLLFDRAFGLLPTSPVYLLAFVGVLPAWRFSKRIAAAVLATIVVFTIFAAVNQFWYGGYAPPPRYIFPVVALLAPFGARALEGIRETSIVRFLTGWSLVVAVLYTAFPETRLSFWDGTSAAGAFFDRNFGFDPTEALPTFVRAGALDYALAALWGGAAVLCVRRLARRSGANDSDRTDAPAAEHPPTGVAGPGAGGPLTEP
jgi:hypothetical protein